MPTDGARLWIWSDLHFNDERIRSNAKRPFPTVRAMTGVLRDRWREAVAPGDTVVCAGDLGGRRNIFGRWKPPCENLPGRRSSFSATTISPGSGGGSARWESMFR